MYNDRMPRHPFGRKTDQPIHQTITKKSISIVALGANRDGPAGGEGDLVGGGEPELEVGALVKREVQVRLLFFCLWVWVGWDAGSCEGIGWMCQEK